MAQASGTPLPSPKTSIFDITLPGHAAPVAEALPESPDPLLRARSSLFDATLTDIPAPEKTRSFFSILGGLFSRSKVPEAPGDPMESAAEEVALDRLRTAALQVPLSPRSSIFEATRPGTAVLPEDPLEVPVQAKPSLPSVPMDSEEWDEGTAAEWNPRWNAAPSQDPKPPPLARPSLRKAFVVTGVLASAATLAAFALFHRGAENAGIELESKPVPAALQAYQARAKSGDAAAMRMLGLCYCYGIASPADWPTGVQWLRRAARAGNATASKELASMGIRAD